MKATSPYATDEFRSNLIVMPERRTPVLDTLPYPSCAVGLRAALLFQLVLGLFIWIVVSACQELVR
jgi:hypothetical protein